MGKIAETLRGWVKPRGGATISDALNYIETGDPAALDRVRSFRVWEYWKDHLTSVIAVSGAMGEEDRRALSVLAAAERFDQIGLWLRRALARARGDENLHEIFREALATAKLPAARVSTITLTYVEDLARGGRPNSAGRYLLSLPDADLKAAVKQAGDMQAASPGLLARLAEFVLDNAPERLEPLLDVMPISPDVCEVILRKGTDRYEPAAVAAWRKLKREDRFALGQILARHDPERYGREMRDFARAVLADEKAVQLHGNAGIWMVQNDGALVLDELVAYVDRTAKSEGYWHQGNRSRVTSAAVKALGAGALPVVLATLRTWEAAAHRAALSHLIEFDDGSHEARIRSELERGLAESGELYTRGIACLALGHLAGYINLAARWKPATVADRLWELLGHKTKDVREAAARALGRIGAGVVPRAAGMLEDRKADNRAAAVIVLATVGTPDALQALERRLDEETTDDIRDAMLLALDAALVASGREVTREEIDRRIERMAPKLKSPVVDWLDESRLPALRDRDGNPLAPEATRYLLYRQSRAREIQPDVEARPLYALIDRSTSGAFALEVLRRFATSKADAKDRWALAIAGLLGDDRLMPILNQMIQSWVESNRAKMAEYAVQALALLGTDAALMSVDATAIRYRVKNKNIGAAAQEAFAATAERLGLTVDELGDRVVPWMGFEPGKPRVVGPEGKRIEVAIGPDFKLKYRDVEKNKAVASLPKSLPKEILAEFKEMGATLREVAKAQKLRLETLMVRQFHWPVPRWRELFLGHPVLFLPFATRLVWGHYDEAARLRGTFRALEDRTLTDASDEPFDLPDTSSVGIVHPLELDDEALGAWRTHLADYEVEPPFPQLERPVIWVSDDQRAVRISPELSGTSLNAMTFRSRSEKLGWVRGSVTSGGYVCTYRKVFSGAGVEAFVGLQGLSVGIGTDASIELQDFCFVHAGSVRTGSYEDDDPRDKGDARLIAFGAVPPLVYSEVMGDLRRIAGQAAEEGADPGEG